MFALHEKSALSFHRRLFRGGFCGYAKTPVGEPIVSCDGRKNCRGTNCDELVALDEDDIGAAGLLDLCACS